MSNYPMPLAVDRAAALNLDSQEQEELPLVLGRVLAMYFGLALFMAVLSPLYVLVFAALTIYSARGPRQTLEGMTVFLLLLLGNRAIFSGGTDAFRWIFLFSCFGRLLWDTVLPQKDAGNLPRSLAYAIGIFFTTSLLLAIVGSKMPGLSIFKLLSYTIGVVTIFVCAYRTRHLHEYWQSWLSTFFVFVILASGLAFVTGLGNVRTASLFQGIWAHPQILGPVSGVMVAWFGGQVFFRRRITMPIVLSLFSLLLVYYSGARTGGFALVFGFALTWALWKLVLRRTLPMSSLRTSGIMLLMLFVAVPVLVLKGPSLTTAIQEYILKDDFSEGYEEGRPGASEVFAESRGDRMNASMRNFWDSPLTGIGFGVPTTWEFYRGVETGALGIPVGASFEKGFMPSAILEEMGILGTITVILMFLAFAVPIHRYAPFHVIWMFWSALAMNVGAAIYFSIGGVGMIMWLMVGFCYNAACGIREEQEATVEPT